MQTTTLNPEVCEYVGQCFQFPYDSHYQVNFDHETGTSQAIVLTPYGVLSSNLVENALIQKYGEPKYCEKASSPVQLVRTNRVRKFHNQGRLDKIRNERLTIYAGDCEKPVVFAIEDRFVLLFDRINPENIARDFDRRRANAEMVKDNKRELEQRRNQLNDFF